MTKNVEIEISIPFEFSLHQNYPNPFNPATTIDFSISNKTKVRLEVFNSLGQKVAKLVDNYLDSGNHSVVFTAKDLASGIYYYKLSADNFTETKKLIILK